MNSAGLPIIPSFVTVHLGAPDTAAANVRLPFPDYIKNVASSEIYPTWPQEALIANIYAQISFAMNRIYTEFYRSRGYDFDITNTTSRDQAFVNGRDIFENISDIVDGIFNSYIRRRTSIEPLFSAYCDGIRTTCDGLSQWGSVELANSGLDAVDILKSYYGEDIEIVSDVEIADIEESYPGVPLSVGTNGNEVRLIQLRLNRISTNYPAIPKIYPTDGIFGMETEAAVREFQRIFDLGVDGIVGKQTWYRIVYLYNGIKRLSEIISEGIEYADIERQFDEELGPGSSGRDVAGVQYFLTLISEYNDAIPAPEINGYYDDATRRSVEAFQRASGLEVTGIIRLVDWRAIYNSYSGIIASLPDSAFAERSRPYPGVTLRVGSRGSDVEYLQEYLRTISSVYPEIPTVEVDGIFGELTEAAVIEFQEMRGITPDGNVGAVTWEQIGEVYDEIILGYERSEGQYPGYDIG